MSKLSLRAFECLLKSYRYLVEEMRQKSVFFFFFFYLVFQCSTTSDFSPIFDQLCDGIWPLECMASLHGARNVQNVFGFLLATLREFLLVCLFFFSLSLPLNWKIHPLPNFFKTKRAIKKQNLNMSFLIYSNLFSRKLFNS